MFRILKNRNFFIMLVVDICMLFVSLFLAYYLRFDGDIPSDEFFRFLKIVIWVVPLKLLFFLYFGLYKGMWRYTGIQDMKNLFKACLVSTGAIVGILLLTIRFQGYPRSIFPLDFMLTFVLAGGMRMGIRLYLGRSDSKSSFGFSVLGSELKGGALRTPKNVLIVGAGDAGEKTLRELKENIRLNYRAIGFVDDDPNKQGRGVHDVPVLGRLGDIPRIVLKEGVEEIIIAIPSATGKQMREIVAQCETCGVAFKTLPGMGELIDGRVSVKALRDVDYHDLLGRPKVDLDMAAIGEYLTNKVVLVTGAEVGGQRSEV